MQFNRPHMTNNNYGQLILAMIFVSNLQMSLSQLVLC